MKKSEQKITLAKEPSAKEKLFVEEYLRNGFNQTQAYGAIVATKRGSKENWHSQATVFIRRVTVQQFLQERLNQRKKELHVDQTYVVRKCLEIVEADFVSATQYLTKGELDRMPPALRKLIVSIDSDTSTHTWNEKYGRDEGKHEEITEKYKVTFMSKDKALDALGKHTGTYLKDNVSLQGNIETKSFTDAVKELDI